MGQLNIFNHWRPVASIVFDVNVLSVQQADMLNTNSCVNNVCNGHCRYMVHCAVYSLGLNVTPIYSVGTNVSYVCYIVVF